MSVVTRESADTLSDRMGGGGGGGNAAVYAGSQRRSWHGTSEQVVQPQSGLKVLLPF